MAKLVCDPQTGVDTYEVDGLPGGTVQVPAQPDGSLLLDLGAIPAGSYSLNVAAEEGVFKSDSAPFGFTSPALTPPVGLRLIA